MYHIRLNSYHTRQVHPSKTPSQHRAAIRSMVLSDRIAALRISILFTAADSYRKGTSKQMPQEKLPSIAISYFNFLGTGFILIFSLCKLKRQPQDSPPRPTKK